MSATLVYFCGIRLVSNTNKILAQLKYCWLSQNYQQYLGVLIVYDFLSIVQGRPQTPLLMSSTHRELLVPSLDAVSGSTVILHEDDR